MKIVPIFVSDDSEDGLWSIHFENERQNEFEKFFALVNDNGWLYEFFSKNSFYLARGYFGRVTVWESVLRTKEEVREMRELLYKYLRQGFTGIDVSLQHLFKPLNNFEYAITSHQKSKARVNNGWLRLYAIRLTANCYLVTGGAIKLTQDMRSDHLQTELIKLDRVKSFLRINGIDYPEDLNTYQDE